MYFLFTLASRSVFKCFRVLGGWLHNNDVDTAGTTQCASVKPGVFVTVEKSLLQTPSDFVDVFVAKKMEQAFGATLTTTISDCIIHFGKTYGFVLYMLLHQGNNIPYQEGLLAVSLWIY